MTSLIMTGLLGALLAPPAPAPAMHRSDAIPRSAHAAAVGPCPRIPVAGAVATATPWPQQRLVPDRFAGLADGHGVTVAVVDSGVDATHPQLAGRVGAGADFLTGTGDGRRDCVGHGTAVASIIAAVPRAGVALRGLAPGARILPVRVSEQQVIDGRVSGETVSAAGFAAAIRWSVDHGAGVLNLSVVLYRDDPAVRAAVRYARDHDVVVVAAAGNLGGQGNPTPFPASYAGVIGVGAIGADGALLPDSQTGGYVDVVAPGAGVTAAATGHGYAGYQGTSFAVPFVAATAALVRQYRPDLSAGQVVDRILATADPPPTAVGYGAGVLNPYRAITETSAGPAPASAGSPEPVRAAAVATAEPRHARARTGALRLAATGAALAGLTMMLAAALPRAGRRGWRPAGRR